jgi:hypothetical protein
LSDWRVFVTGLEEFFVFMGLCLCPPMVIQPKGKFRR